MFQIRLSIYYELPAYAQHMCELDHRVQGLSRLCSTRAPGCMRPTMTARIVHDVVIGRNRSQGEHCFPFSFTFLLRPFPFPAIRDIGRAIALEIPQLLRG